MTVAFYQMADDGTPDYDDPCDLVAVGCLAVVSFEATYQPDHADHRQHRSSGAA